LIWTWFAISKGAPQRAGAAPYQTQINEELRRVMERGQGANQLSNEALLATTGRAAAL